MKLSSLHSVISEASLWSPDNPQGARFDLDDVEVVADYIEEKGGDPADLHALTLLVVDEYYAKRDNAGLKSLLAFIKRFNATNPHGDDDIYYYGQEFELGELMERLHRLLVGAAGPWMVVGPGALVSGWTADTMRKRLVFVANNVDKRANSIDMLVEALNDYLDKECVDAIVVLLDAMSLASGRLNAIAQHVLPRINWPTNA